MPTKRSARRGANRPGATNTNTDSVARGTVTGELALNLRPVAYASLFAPAGRRRLWAMTYRCPLCHAGHLGRGETAEAVVGHRRSGCGRLVWVVAARTYSGEAA